MKVFLDDERTTPEGWVRVFRADETIELLKGGHVTLLSLDHDLGSPDRGTGYDVLLWIEQAVATQNFRPPVIRIHSSNAAAVPRMVQAVEKIYELYEHRTRV